MIVVPAPERTKFSNVVGLVFACLLAAAYALFPAVWLSSLVPGENQVDLFRGYVVSLHPNHRLFFYDAYIALGIVLVAAGIKVFSNRLDEPRFGRVLGWVLVGEMLGMAVIFILVR